MNTKNTAVWMVMIVAASVIGIVVVTLLTVLHVTNPYRGYDWDRLDTGTPAPVVEQECPAPDYCGLVPNPGVRPSVDPRIIEELEEIYGTGNS
jgi:hypothetical protein